MRVRIALSLGPERFGGHGPSSTIGAVRPDKRSAPVKVAVFQCPCGIGARQRCPRKARVAAVLLKHGYRARCALVHVQPVSLSKPDQPDTAFSNAILKQRKAIRPAVSHRLVPGPFLDTGQTELDDHPIERTSRPETARDGALANFFHTEGDRCCQTELQP